MTYKAIGKRVSSIPNRREDARVELISGQDLYSV